MGCAMWARESELPRSVVVDLAGRQDCFGREALGSIPGCYQEYCLKCFWFGNDDRRPVGGHSEAGHAQTAALKCLESRPELT
jgi:hypothetical protein